MNLLLIDSRIPDIENIRNSVTENTFCILFDYKTDTLDTIKNQIQCTYENVGIIQHNYDISTFQLLETASLSTLSNVSTVDPTLTTWREYIEFFEWFTSNGTQHIDLFACNLWADTNWRYVIETIRNIYAVHIRASIDITGDGGNFVLESDNVDTIGIYFLPDILDYKYAFYYAPVGSTDPNYLYAKNYEFPFPSTNLGTFDSSNSNYSSTFGTYGSAPVINKSGIKQVVTNAAGCVAILFNNGTVFTYGSSVVNNNINNYGQTAPVDINTGSPVTKIVASEYGFVALKSNGTVKWWGSYTFSAINDQTVDTYGLVLFYNQTITNIVDIYASTSVCFARDINGKIFAWGYSNNIYTVGTVGYSHDIFTNNYPSPQNTVKNYIQTGILSVHVTNEYVHFVKNDNTFMIVEIYGGDAGSSKYIQYTIPSGYTVHDILLITPNAVSGIVGSFKTHVRTCIPIITNGTKLFLWDFLYSTNNVIELCDINTTIVKKGMTKGYTTQNMNNPVHVFACLLSNSTFIWIDYSPIYFDNGYSIIKEKRPIRVTDISNVTDFTIDGIIIQNGNVFDIKTNTPTQKTSNTLNSVIDSLANNVVQLFYTTTTIGALLSNRSFTYWPISGTTNPYTLSTDLRNQMTSGVINVYDTADGYMLIKDTSFVWIGSSTTKIFGFENYTKTAGSSPNIGTLPSNKNLFLLSTSRNVMPIELEKNTTSLSSLSVANNILQINNGDPNRMAHYGRTYKLYDITEPTDPVVISTFTASYEIMTFTFPNIPNTFYGAYTLSIVDTTNTPATMTVIDAFYSNITNPNAAIFTYSYTPIHLIRNKTFDFTFYSSSTFSLGTYSLKDASMQTLSTITLSTATNTIIFSNVDTTNLMLGMNSLYVYYNNTTKLNRFAMLINATCFLEGTKILTMDIRKHKTRYIPIEKLKPGMLVKTLSSGFIPIKHIGYSTIYNPGLSTYVKDQLFIYKKTVYPELIEDLVLTGTHSILVKTITDTDRKNIIDTLGGICVTENRYRLPAFNDSNAVRYERQGEFRIWNLALENESYHGNYGIYANGLLVETTSCRYITELSGMKLVE